uniref:Uncharacterized protein n=1 Tax=Anopheles melas TaxID=34690 RepID=A0A182UAC4_9DIPT
MPNSISPASAVMKLDLPQPGGPCSRYPRRCRASSRILKYKFLSLPNAVSCTVSQGTPMCRSSVCCSRARSTFIQVPPYRMMCVPTEGIKSYRVLMCPVSRCSKDVSTLRCCVCRAPFCVIHCSSHWYDLSRHGTSSVIM